MLLMGFEPATYQPEVCDADHSTTTAGLGNKTFSSPFFLWVELFWSFHFVLIPLASLLCSVVMLAWKLDHCFFHFSVDHWGGLPWVLEVPAFTCMGLGFDNRQHTPCWHRPLASHLINIQKLKDGRGGDDEQTNQKWNVFCAVGEAHLIYSY